MQGQAGPAGCLGIQVHLGQDVLQLHWFSDEGAD